MKRVKVKGFQIVHVEGGYFILALGRDGNVWECAGRHWLKLPIDKRSTKPQNVIPARDSDPAEQAEGQT